MNKQWNKDMHDRLKDFPKKAPEGLLDDIKAEMVRRGLSSAPATNRFQSVALRVASVAALILILFGTSYLFQWKEPSVIPVGQEKELLPTTTNPIPAQTVAVNNTPIASSAAPKKFKVAKATDVQDDTIINPDTLITQEDTLSKQVTEKKEYSHPAPVHQQQPLAYVPKKQKKSSFDISLYYSGAITNMDINTHEYLLDVALPPIGGPNFGTITNGSSSSDNTNSTDSTATKGRSLSRSSSAPSFKRNKQGETAKHHLPVRLGVSFRYYLNDLWNIQSGLTYSYWDSDLSYRNQKTSYETKQRLHYIGIPLQAGIRIGESKHFRSYFSIGGQVEKLVSGKATTHYLLDQQQTGTLTENINDKKLLFSALASISAEYMLRKEMSLYAEPGIHYYLKNGNNLQTLYNEKPLSFNLTIGVRFHWKK